MSEETRAHARRWDERYAGEHYHFGTEPNAFLARVEPDLPRGRALCYGDGEGRNGVFLAKRRFEVTSMDASQVGMAKASRLAEQQGVNLTTVVSDLREFDFGVRQWDVIVSIFVHLFPDLRHRVHRGIVDALRPGGAFVLEAYTPEQLHYRTGGPPREDLMMTLPMLREDLRGLELEIGEERIRDVVEGRGHNGKAAVVQVLARKPAD